MNSIAELLGMNTTPWMDNPDRNCAAGAFATAREVETHADSWFPTDTNETPQAAKKLCRGCPVQTECLTWALDKKEHGIWGSTTSAQRERLRKKRAAA